MYALAQQLFGIADNMLDMKWGNLTAAVIIDMKTWRRIKPKHQQAMLTASKKIGNRFQSKNRHESDKAIDVMKQHGLTVNTPTTEQVNAWKNLIEGMAPDFRGTVIDEKAFDRLMEIKKEMDTR
jgi:TRAP-type C4-dicarboxylate transport system substrate-binding protein